MRYEHNLSTGVTTELDDLSISVEQAATNAAYDALAWERSRKAKYNLLNQFEMQFDDAANGTTTWIDAINAIKQEFPK